MNALQQSVGVDPTQGDVDSASQASPPLFADIDLRTISPFDTLDDALTKPCHQQALSDTSDAALRDLSSVQIPASPSPSVNLPSNLSPLDIDGLGPSLLRPTHSPRQTQSNDVQQVPDDNTEDTLAD